MQFSKMAGSFEANIFSKLNDKKIEYLSTGREVFNFSVGSPDFPPDGHVIRALCKAAQAPENYAYSLADLPELTRAVIDWYHRRYHVDLEPDEITSIYGSQEGIAHIPFTICDPGDTVLAPDPGYPIFCFGPFMASAKVVFTPLLKENHFLVDFDSIDREIARKAKLIIVSYPSNPVSVKADPEFYERLVHFCKKYDIIALHDNAYSEIVMEGEPGISFLSIPGAKEVGIEVNSLSKTYNIPGCRISFALGNRELIGKIKKLRSQIDYGIFYPVQYAAIAALNGPQDIVERNRKNYRQRRDALCEGMRRIGWDVPDSEGTMFSWVPLPKGFTDSFDFTMKLIEQCGVIATPGISFGSRGEGFLRFALVLPPEKIRLALEKIEQSGLLQQA